MIELEKILMGNRNKKVYKFKIFRNQTERNIHCELLTFGNSEI